MNVKGALLSILLSPLVAVAASNCIVSGSIVRLPVHSVDSPSSPAVALDVRGGSSGARDLTTTPSDVFEARAWSHAGSNALALDCLPCGSVFLFR